jgi:hypothetical protein
MMPVAVHLEAWHGVRRCLVHAVVTHHHCNLRHTKMCVCAFIWMREGWGVAVSVQCSAISTTRHRCCAMVVHVSRQERNVFHYPGVM